ncbi:hypothetical protein ACSSV1_006164 [Labrenzia sp. MBR-25]|jgi:hypothetical protein
MPRNIDDRLTRLKDRRTDADVIEKAFLSEKYENRTQDKATRYALGAMQEVEPRYIEISVEEAEKVERNLREGLDAESLKPDFRLQGSVPLNVHVRGVSDVDLLVVEGLYLKCATVTSNSRAAYSDYTGRGSVLDDVLHLRRKSEEVLERRFWGATVDKTPAKSIQLSGGGFRRKVDVVPSNWYDSEEYQRTLEETHRGIDIINKYTRQSIRNYPFMYIKEINSKDFLTDGGAKMAIRLVKNIRNDAENEIGLSSYDIGSLIYNCPYNYITSHPGADLKILSGVDQWFSELAADQYRTMNLNSPDGTRKVIDSQDKWNAVLKMADEINELAREVELEVIGPLMVHTLDKMQRRQRMGDKYIPLY